MIRPNDVRIGNKVILRGKIITVSTNCILNMNTGMADRYEPIPLNEKWFQKLGFEKHHVQLCPEMYIIYRIYPLSKSNFLYIQGLASTIKGDFSSATYRCYREDVGELISSVHQLQNFYYALTGNEFKIGTINEDLIPRQCEPVYKFVKEYKIEDFDESYHIVRVGSLLMKSSFLNAGPWEVHTSSGMPCSFYFSGAGLETLLNDGFIKKIGD